MIERKDGLTYADSGVDIDAGNRLVDMIKPLVRATARAGSCDSAAAMVVISAPVREK